MYKLFLILTVWGEKARKSNASVLKVQINNWQINVFCFIFKYEDLEEWLIIFQLQGFSMWNLFYSYLFYLLLQVNKCRLSYFSCWKYIGWYFSIFIYIFLELTYLLSDVICLHLSCSVRFVCVPWLGFIITVARSFPRNISNDLTFPFIR